MKAACSKPRAVAGGSSWRCLLAPLCPRHTHPTPPPTPPRHTLLLHLIPRHPLLPLPLCSYFCIASGLELACTVDMQSIVG